MKKLLFRKKTMVLFSLAFMILSLQNGCIDIDHKEIKIENVTNQEPYSQFIEKKYRLKQNCYLTKSDSDYFIHICGKHDAPLEFDEKYIGTEIRGGIIVALLPKGSEFIVKRISLMHSNGGVIFTNTYVEITSNKIIASALLLVRGDPSTLVFEDGCAEMVDPESEKK